MSTDSKTQPNFKNFFKDSERGSIMNIITFKPNNLVDRFFENDPIFNTEVSRQPEWAASKNESVKVNLVETENSFILTAQVPGMTDKNINVETRDGKLFIRGQWGEEAEQKVNKYLMREFLNQNFERSFVLGDGVDPEKISAKLEHGILTLVLPKREEIVPKTVKVEIQGGS